MTKAQETILGTVLFIASAGAVLIGLIWRAQQIGALMQQHQSLTVWGIAPHFFAQKNREEYNISILFKILSQVKSYIDHIGLSLRDRAQVCSQSLLMWSQQPLLPARIELSWWVSFHRVRLVCVASSLDRSLTYSLISQDTNCYISDVLLIYH